MHEDLAGLRELRPGRRYGRADGTALVVGGLVRVNTAHGLCLNHTLNEDDAERVQRPPDP